MMKKIVTGVLVSAWILAVSAIAGVILSDPRYAQPPWYIGLRNGLDRLGFLGFQFSGVFYRFYWLVVCAVVLVFYRRLTARGAFRSGGMSLMKTARTYAMCLLLVLLAIGVFLSVRTHLDARFGYSLAITDVRFAAITCGVMYVCVYGADRLAGKWRDSIRSGVCVVVLVILGLAVLLQGPEQMEKVGFAAGNRIPDPAAVGLAVGGSGLALWQAVNNFWGRRLLSNSFVILALVFLNVYLFFAAW